MRERWRAIPWRTGEPLPLSRGGGWDGLRLGSEACARLVPAASRVGGIDHAAFAPDAFSLVTPLLAPSEFSRVLATALAALEAGWSEVVVNDWGLLHALASEAGRRAKGPWLGGITAGRLLMRARRGPGEGDPWAGLDPASREYFAWGPLRDRPFLDFLRGQGVSRLELDPPRHRHPLRAPEGFLLSLHADHRLVTLAGNCPFLYRVGREGEGRWEEGDCRLACRESPIHLTAPNLARPLLQWGRLVLEEAPDAFAGEELPAEADRLVFSPNLFPQMP